MKAQKLWLIDTLLFSIPLAVQLAVLVVLRLSVRVPLKRAGLITPVQESGQLYLKQMLKLMAPVFVQADKLLMVTVTAEPLLVTVMQPGRLAVQDGS